MAASAVLLLAWLSWLRGRLSQNLNRDMLIAAAADIADEVRRVLASGVDLSIEFRVGRLVQRSGSVHFYFSGHLCDKIVKV